MVLYTGLSTKKSYNAGYHAADQYTSNCAAGIKSSGKMRRA